MSWLRLDDTFDSHPKVVELSELERWRWVRVLLYCARGETDGAISAAALRELRAPVARLVAVGLLELEGSGYRVRSYLDFNPSHAEKELEREKWRRWQADSRARRAGRRSGAESGPDTVPESGRLSALVRVHPFPLTPLGTGPLLRTAVRPRRARLRSSSSRAASGTAARSAGSSRRASSSSARGSSKAHRPSSRSSSRCGSLAPSSSASATASPRTGSILPASCWHPCALRWGRRDAVRRSPGAARAPATRVPRLPCLPRALRSCAHAVVPLVRWLARIRRGRGRRARGLGGGGRADRRSPVACASPVAYTPLPADQTPRSPVPSDPNYKVPA